MALVSEAKELIKSMTEWVVLCGAAQVPFPHKRTDITAFEQVLCQCHFGRGEARFWIVVVVTGGIELVAEASLISAC